MDLDTKPKAIESPAAPTDPLSQAWCFSALQIFQTADSPVHISPKMERTLTKESADHKSTMPPWKLDDLKSWIWMQQAIHPEVDYDRCFHKKWLSKKISPLKSISIKKWMKETKQKRKEEERLQRAEVHAAISVAGVAAALAAVAAENAGFRQPPTSRENAAAMADSSAALVTAQREKAVASAAALVAAQCAQIAEAAGAKREQLTAAMNAAMAATDANGILTLTAAASTSLRGAATLRGRPGRKEAAANRGIPTLLHEECDFEFGNYRSLLAKGDEFLVVTPDGTYRTRLVCVVLNKDAKVVLKTKKIHTIRAFGRAEESVVLNINGGHDKDLVQKADSDYSIAITTSRGEIKLKTTDYECYRIWTKTINHMLMLSTTFTKYDAQFCKNQCVP